MLDSLKTITSTAWDTTIKAIVPLILIAVGSVFRIYLSSYVGWIVLRVFLIFSVVSLLFWKKMADFLSERSANSTIWTISILLLSLCVILTAVYIGVNHVVISELHQEVLIIGSDYTEGAKDFILNDPDPAFTPDPYSIFRSFGGKAELVWEDVAFFRNVLYGLVFLFVFLSVGAMTLLKGPRVSGIVPQVATPPTSTTAP
jgi:hypothetical protein